MYKTSALLLPGSPAVSTSTCVRLYLLYSVTTVTLQPEFQRRGQSCRESSRTWRQSPIILVAKQFFTVLRYTMVQYKSEFVCHRTLLCSSDPGVLFTMHDVQKYKLEHLRLFHTSWNMVIIKSDMVFAFYKQSHIFFFKSQLHESSKEDPDA